MDTCWHCGEEIHADERVEEMVVSLPDADHWAPVHGEGCPRDRLPALLHQYAEAKAKLDTATAEIDKLKDQLDVVLGTREALADCGYELRRVPPTVIKRWDNRALNDLVFMLRRTDNDPLADAIRECQREEPRRGYLRIGKAD